MKILFFLVGFRVFTIACMAGVFPLFAQGVTYRCDVATQITDVKVCDRSQYIPRPTVVTIAISNEFLTNGANGKFHDMKCSGERLPLPLS